MSTAPRHPADVAAGMAFRHRMEAVREFREPEERQHLKAAEALEELAVKLREEWLWFQPGVAYEPVDPDLHQDAARYRWLRADHAYFPEEMAIFGGPDLDAAIDAAIEEERHDPRDP